MGRAANEIVKWINIILHCFDFHNSRNWFFRKKKHFITFEMPSFSTISFFLGLVDSKHMKKIFKSDGTFLTAEKLWGFLIISNWKMDWKEFCNNDYDMHTIRKEKQGQQ